MLKLNRWALPGLLLTLFTAQASTILVTTPAALGADTAVSWAQLGGDQTTLGAAFVANTPITVNGTFANGAGSIIAVVCPAASCSWVTSGTGMNAGDSLIWTSNNGSGGNAPLTLAFTAEFGAGLWLQSDTPGRFTASIQAFNGGTALFGSAQTVQSNVSGDPIFIGALDTLREITSIQLDLTANTGGGNLHDFGVDQLNLKTTNGTAPGVPEPATFWLAAALLPVLAWRRNGIISAISVRFKGVGNE